ncbi:MAG: carboxypeptidase regulatory-like domain-containing protein, partial [Planctomycetes bacterium]|nr:carboxypeptidase regulatory-like domain-containing protein [Planctomycetota bacterium]
SEAARLWEGVPIGYPPRTADLLRVARNVLARGELAEALELLERFLMLDPGRGEVYLLRAEVNRQLGRHAEAEADEARARELGTSDPEELRIFEGEVRGQVLDAWGAPVPGAEVLELERTQTVASCFGPIESVVPSHRADAQGAFRFATASTRETVTISARAPGHGPGPATVAVIGGPPVALRLAPEARLEVLVRDRLSGAPIAGAEVQVDETRVTTDALGRAQVGSLGEGLHPVTISAPGYSLWQRGEVPTSPTAVQLLAVELDRGRRLEGTLRSPRGEPLASAAVTVAGRMATTDAAGRYALVDLPPGRHVLTAQTPALGYTAEVDLDLARTLDAVLEPKVLLRVRLTRAGSPTSAVIEVQRFGRTESRLYQEAEGGSLSARLLPGRVELSLGGGSAVGRRTVDLVPGQTLDLAWELPGDNARARLLQANGQPAAQAYVVICRQREQVGYAVTDARGEAHLVVEPGIYDVYARDLAHRAVSFRRGVMLPADLELTLAPGGRFAGRLLDPAGAPLAKFRVTVVGVEHSARREAVTDAEGRFEVEELYTGRYRFELDRGQLEVEALRRGASGLSLDPVEAAALAGETREVVLRLR